MVQTLKSYKESKNQFRYIDKQGIKIFNTNFHIEDCQTIK